MEISGDREKVFKGIKNGLLGGLHGAERERLRNSAEKNNLFCNEVRDIARRIGLNWSGDFSIRSTLVDVENKERELSTEDLLSWMT